MSRLSFLIPIYVLATTASSGLPPPRNVQLISENFRHVLTWENNHLGASVAYSHCPGTWQTLLKPVPKCSNVTSQHCDLTEYFTDLNGCYLGHVQSVGYNETSEFSISTKCEPLENTLLGPPIVHVTACNKCVNVSISPPISHIPSGDKNRTISMLSDNVYPILEYTITVTTEKEYARQETKLVAQENYFFVIKNLTPNTHYCVSVNASASLNLNENQIPSALQCVITEPLQLKGGSAALFGFSVGGALLFLIGLVFCLIALDRAGYIFLGKPFLPKILKSMPQSGSMFYENKDELCSPASIVRMENTEPKVDDESRDEKSGLGYAQRKKILDSDQSTTSGVNNNAFLYSTTSSSSGQGSGSSAETGTSRETAMLVDIGGSCSSDTDVPVGFEMNPNLSLNTSGTFNINLNSVSVGDPENLWTGLRKGPPSEKVAEAMDNSQGPVPVVLGSQGLPLFPNKVEASGLPERDDYNSEEELDYDRSETSEEEEPIVSDYMRRSLYDSCQAADSKDLNEEGSKPLLGAKNCIELGGNFYDNTEM